MNKLKALIIEYLSLIALLNAFYALFLTEYMNVYIGFCQYWLSPILVLIAFRKSRRTEQ